MYTVYQRVVGGKNREFIEPLNEESGGRRKCKEQSPRSKERHERDIFENGDYEEKK